MIRFTCLCQSRIEVADDLAGGLTQCPRCGRLNDVPTLSDLPHLADDGTYVVDVERPKDDPIRLAELNIIYSKGTVDSEGDEIDLRIAAGELAVGDDSATAGAEGDDDGGAIPLKDEPPRRGAPTRAARPAPRYDPETGELIVAVELAPDPDRPENPAAIPIARAAINYATGDAARRVSPARVAVELLMPVNVAVMTFIFITHVLLQFTGTVTVSGLWMVVIIPLILAGVIISHYGNVIDETGPQERDELPRPLRSVGLFEDLWNPFVNVICALAICFAPAVLVAIRLAGSVAPPVAMAAAGLLLLAGVAALPGVLLTTNTSGSIVNLRPDRFLGMVRACGAAYGLAVLSGLLATFTYGFGIIAADLTFIRVLTGARSPLPAWVHLAGYPMLATGIYCAHLFCWHLGLLYREHHAQFPWAYQRHVRDPMKQAAPGARLGSLRDAAASAGNTGATQAQARPRKDTKAKLRELREMERRRQAQQRTTDRKTGQQAADVRD